MFQYVCEVLLCAYLTTTGLVTTDLGPKYVPIIEEIIIETKQEFEEVTGKNVDDVYVNAFVYKNKQDYKAFAEKEGYGHTDGLSFDNHMFVTHLHPKYFKSLAKHEATHTLIYAKYPQATNVEYFHEGLAELAGEHYVIKNIAYFCKFRHSINYILFWPYDSIPYTNYKVLMNYIIDTGQFNKVSREPFRYKYTLYKQQSQFILYGNQLCDNTLPILSK